MTDHTICLYTPLYDIGERVALLGDKNVIALVTEICFRSAGGAVYRCVWQDGRSIKDEWLVEIALGPVEAQ